MSNLFTFLCFFSVASALRIGKPVEDHDQYEPQSVDELTIQPEHVTNLTAEETTGESDMHWKNIIEQWPKLKEKCGTSESTVEKSCAIKYFPEVYKNSRKLMETETKRLSQTTDPVGRWQKACARYYQNIGTCMRLISDYTQYAPALWLAQCSGMSLFVTNMQDPFNPVPYLGYCIGSNAQMGYYGGGGNPNKSFWGKIDNFMCWDQSGSQPSWVAHKDFPSQPSCMKYCLKDAPDTQYVVYNRVEKKCACQSTCANDQSKMSADNHHDTYFRDLDLNFWQREEGGYCKKMEVEENDDGEVEHFPTVQSCLERCKEKSGWQEEDSFVVYGVREVGRKSCACPTVCTGLVMDNDKIFDTYVRKGHSWK